MRAVVKATLKVRKRKPDEFFRKETKDRYDENLGEVQSTIMSWIDQLHE